MTELFRIFKMTLPEIFSFLNNVSIRRNICLNFQMFKRETPDVFFLFPAAMLVPTASPITKLSKFVWNIMSNNSSMECCTDQLRLGQSTYLFIVYSV